MFVEMVVFPIKDPTPAKEEKIVELWRELAVPRLRRQRGFVSSQVLRSADKAGEVREVLTWESREDAEAWGKSPSLLEIVPQFLDAVGQSIKKHGYERVGLAEA